jgi:acetyl-CoA carboxylase alpha subunit
MTLQKVNNHTIEDLMDSERDGFSDAEARRMMTRMFNELKEDIQQLNESKENTGKNSRRDKNN